MEQGMSKKNQENRDNEKQTEAFEQKENLGTLDIEGLEKEGKTENVKIGSVLFKCLKFLMGVATVATAILGWRTLIEMQTERDNAYRPVIVIGPAKFEGGQVGSVDLDPNREYVFINNLTSNPRLWYVGALRDGEYEEGNWGANDSPWEDTRLLYLETPYLSLQNIGQGTAKDVEVTFSMEWLSNAVDLLNSDTEDEHIYTINISPSNDSFIDYVTSSEDDTPYDFLGAFEVGEKNIINCTYISPNEDPIKIMLPNSWAEMVTVILAQDTYRYMNVGTPDSGFIIKRLPDLIVTIKYKDIQGKSYEQKEIIPWEIKYRRVESIAPTEHGTLSLSFWTGFYEDYLK